MKREYKQAYLTLTRQNPLPSNCLPFSSRKRGAESLTQLLHLNQTIMNLVDPNFTTVFNQKRKSHAHLISLEKGQESTNISPKRIHPNAAILMSSIRHKSRKSRFMSLQEDSVGDNPKKSQRNIKRQDIYDDHIEKFMSSKYDRDAIIQQYLNNKDQFVKMACQEIQQQIKQKVSPRKSAEKLQEKSTHRLPKIQEFSSYKLKKSTHRAKPAEYIKSITHLKKAQTLDLKQRQRKQRAFRLKINSLECRLDKIRDSSLG